MSDTTKSVSIPVELYNAIGERVKDSEFTSVEEYVIFVMEEVIKDEEEEMAFSEEDEEEVKKRLRALGYLD